MGRDLDPSFIFWWTRRLLIAALIMMCAGCGVMKSPMAGSTTNYRSPQDAWDALHRNEMDSSTLKAIARISLHDSHQQFYLKGAVMAKKPKYLRFEALPLIGPPDFFLAVNDEKIKVFLPDRGSFYVGEATKENFSAFFPLSLSPEAVVALLMGSCPQAMNSGTYVLQGIVTNDLYRLDLLYHNQVMISCWVDPGYHRIVRYDIFSEKGILMYQVTFNDFFQEKAVSIPMDIEVTTRTGDLKRVVIKLSDIQLVQEDDLTPYDLARPPDAQVIPLNGK
jgi:Domain of unknown function (DUF4292)